MGNIDYVRERLSEEDLYYQLAEEAAELSKAALKMARVIRGKNPTPVTVPEAYADVLSEYADVRVCVEALGLEGNANRTVMDWMKYKKERWVERLRNHK